MTKRSLFLLPLALVIFTALCSDPGTGPEIIVKSGSLRRLTDGPGNYAYPDWSEDGQEIIYVDNTSGSGNTRILSISSDGGEPAELYRERNAGISIAHPHWIPGDAESSFVFLVFDSVKWSFAIRRASPGESGEILFTPDETIFGLDVTTDGKAVLFSPSSQYNPGIFRLDLETKETERLETDITWRLVSHLSCDRTGGTVSFIEVDSTLISYNLFRMPVDGGPARRITDFSRGDLLLLDADRSPDGDQYVIRTSQRFGSGYASNYYYDFYFIPADGGELVPLANFPNSYLVVETTQAPPRHPTWSPDGRSIAFSFGRRGDTGPNIYVIDL